MINNYKKITLEELATFIASSSVSTGINEKTGPNISSFRVSLLLETSITVG
jgi:hypothetical protein